MINDFKAGLKICQAVLVRVQKIGNLPAACWRITVAECLLSALKRGL